MQERWKDLKTKLSPAARARVDARVADTLRSMPLHEIRQAIGLTQAELAGRLDVAQGNVSKLEQAADMYLTTLRKYVESLGGELHLTASFADGRRFEIDQLATLDPQD